jgi:hypothetical protein
MSRIQTKPQTRALCHLNNSVMIATRNSLSIYGIYLSAVFYLRFEATQQHERLTIHYSFVV